jgi:geranylgeranyl diphosphate synthase type I
MINTMTTTTAHTFTGVLEDVEREVDGVLSTFLETKSRNAAHPSVRGILTRLRALVLTGGERLRPRLCVLGWQAAGGLSGGGHGDSHAVAGAAASLEMVHAFTLIHDDIVDDSDTRLGVPTVHRALATHHHERPEAAKLALNAAGLLGDVALVYADEILHGAGLTSAQLRAALPVMNVMRTEVMYGQYLELLATGRPSTDVDGALQIARYKSAKYGIERPLHLGAALGGADDRLRASLTAFALPVGEAFQLREDLVSVFGGPGSADVRPAKQTVLMALALQRASDSDQEHLRRSVAWPEPSETDAARVRMILDDTGARDTVEHMITTRCREALRALAAADLPTETASTLRQIALQAAARRS